MSELVDHVDGIVHQAEDEIAACAVAVGASYADGQYWADVSYTMPSNTARIRVTLQYQTASTEYIGSTTSGAGW